MGRFLCVLAIFTSKKFGLVRFLYLRQGQGAYLASKQTSTNAILDTNMQYLFLPVTIVSGVIGTSALRIGKFDQ